MNNPFKKLEEVKRLVADSRKLNEFHEKYQNRISQSQCDKYGKGFNHDDRFTAFKKTVFFSAKAGDYGSSSTSAQLSLQDGVKVGDALVEWLNQNEELVLKGIGKILEEKSKELLTEATKELEEANNFLDEVRSL